MEIKDSGFLKAVEAFACGKTVYNVNERGIRTYYKDGNPWAPMECEEDEFNDSAAITPMEILNMKWEVVE